MSTIVPSDSMNITISVPPGTTNHGNPHLLCIPPEWYHYFLFLAVNYLAHACTIVSLPGQTWRETVVVAVAALLFPMSGMSRAMAAIMGHAALCSDPIRQAARAGALCMVAKVDEQTPTQHRRQFYRLHRKMDPSKKLIQIDKSGLSVHGSYNLDREWRLVPVSKTASVSMPRNGDKAHTAVSTPYNVPKLLISLFQAFWAISTLYRTRGDQISTYGYAAFGLTVAQYAYMSIINIVGNLLQPQYPSMFMIRTPQMDMARNSGCSFSGELEVDLNDSVLSEDTEPSILRNVLVSLGFGLVPFAVVAWLSYLQPQHSTSAQRLFTMLWLVLSISLGPLLSEILVESRHVGGEAPEGSWWTRANNLLQNTLICVLGLCVLGIPFVGGVIVVMQMIHDFGICTRIY